MILNYDVPVPDGLFSVFGPLVYYPATSSYAGRENDVDWVTFKKRATLLYHVDYPSNQLPRLCDNLLEAIRRQVDRDRSIFEYVNSIRWCADVEGLPVFCTKSLRIVDAIVPRPTKENIDSSAQRLVEESPHIYVLSFSVKDCSGLPCVPPILSLFLHCLTELKDLIIHIDDMTNKVFKIAAKHPTLLTLDTISLGTARHPLWSLPLHAVSSPFPFLTRLHIQVRFESALSILQAENALPLLNDLEFNSPCIEEKIEFANLSNAIAQRPALVSVSLISRDPSSPWAPRVAIHFDDIAPLFTLPGLLSLTIQTHFTPDFNDVVQIERLAKASWRLRSLIFCSHPVVPNRSPFPIDCLQYFVTHCRALKTLGLYLDTRFVPTPRAHTGSFRLSLHVLDVGLSPLRHDQREVLTRYLGSLFLVERTSVFQILEAGGGRSEDWVFLCEQMNILSPSVVVSSERSDDEDDIEPVLSSVW